jgi:hypothetical protein
MLFQGEHEFPFFYATDFNCPKQLITYSLNADKEISSSIGTTVLLHVGRRKE